MYRQYLLVVLFFIFGVTRFISAEPANSLAQDDSTPADILIADFEGDDYGQWRVKGTAFGERPARGTLPGQMNVDGYAGNGLANSFVGGDDSTGELISTEFKISRDHINFLIGGGRHPEKACIQLLIGDSVVRSSTGPNSSAGGSERLDWQHWDVAELRDKTAKIRILDQQEGGWGHINVDQIVLSNTVAKSSINDEQRKLMLEESRLMLPISNDAPQKLVEVVVDGKVVHKLDVNLAQGEPDWWAYLDVKPWQGKQATIKVHQLQKDSTGLASIVSANALPDGENLYNETLRPQFHLSQQRGWNNDPNGMVYFDGKYHFFWQSNPAGWDWSNMYWGHAVSSDLVHWEEKPHALHPYISAEKLCFSGSGNVDKQNSGGWQKGDIPTLLFPFTDTGAGEALVISNDGGNSFQPISENPIIKHQGRDPKLIWYEYQENDRPLNTTAEELGGHWVIVVYDETPEHGQNIAFYVSTDLKEWEFVSRNTGFFECPELFHLNVDGDPQKRKWVMFAADAKYVIGDFDGLHFQSDHENKHQIHHGEFYASQCFSNTPNGRVIQVGWARIPMPGMPFNQTFSLPLELNLRQTDQGVRLFANPIEELEQLRLSQSEWIDQSLVDGRRLKVECESQLLDLRAEISVGDSQSIKLTFGTNDIEIDVEAATVNGIPTELSDGIVKLRLLVDRPMYELLINDGASYLTKPRLDGGKEFNSFEIVATGGDAEIIHLQWNTLKSIWSKQ